MFAKSDEQFAETAVDPVRRRAAIKDLAQRRTAIFACWIIILVAAVGMSWGEKGSTSAIFLPLAILSIFLKFDSDLRLLQVIERLHKDGHLPNGATNVPNDPTIPAC